jgi:hypothetical protein
MVEVRLAGWDGHAAVCLCAFPPESLDSQVRPHLGDNTTRGQRLEGPAGSNHLFENGLFVLSPLSL